MRTVSIIFIVLLLAVPASGEIHTDTGFGCSFDLPTGWSVDTTVTDLIMIRPPSDDSAEIVISKYVLARDSRIESVDDLTEAIAGLYREAGISSVNRDIVDFSVEGALATFGTEFDLHDEQTRTTLHYRLHGLIGRLATGRQVLYLTIASAPPGKFETLRPLTYGLIESLSFTAPLDDEFYVPRSFSPYLMILLILALSAFFYTRNRRVQKSRNPLGKDSGSFWRCSSCGKVNHIDGGLCSRCGRERTTVANIK